jgi:hypothetical protein
MRNLLCFPNAFTLRAASTADAAQSTTQASKE